MIIRESPYSVTRPVRVCGDPSCLSQPQFKLLAAVPSVYSDDPPRLGGAASISEITGVWYAAQTKANAEKRLAWDFLRRFDQVPYYLPMGESITYSGRKRQVFQVPLFRGYLFFAVPQPPPGQSPDASVAFETQRTCRVVEIRQQLRFVAELMNVERALNANPRLEPCPFAVAGSKVRVTKGAFQGVVGQVVRRANGGVLVIEVSGFGKVAVDTTLEIDTRLLEPEL